VTLIIYDCLGRRVRVIVDEVQGPGIYHVAWSGTDRDGAPVASGVYFYRLTWNGKSKARKMVLLD
jgi:hypothetical protein